MSENNNYNKENPDSIPKPKNLGEDFKDWLEKDKQKFVRKSRLEIEDLNKDILGNSLLEKDVLKKEKIHTTFLTPSVSDTKYSSFNQRIVTDSSKKGSVFQGVGETIEVFKDVTIDSFVDLGKFFFSPFKEYDRTMGVLEKQNPYIKQV